MMVRMTLSLALKLGAKEMPSTYKFKESHEAYIWVFDSQLRECDSPILLWELVV